uniref:BTB domain-containing protein n=1 Tax=Plectus sambesii TaxID=2011161 RepID=A0A914X698_9BILA
MTDVVEPTYASRPPPPYRERFPEGRDRLLALSENKPSEIGVGGGGGGSSVVGSSIISSSKPPRMGLRANQKTSRSTSVLRPTAIYASEQSLPDRLTQALKGLSSSLRPTGVAHSASSSSPFKKQQSSSGMVAADDVVYFPSADLYRKRNTTSVIPASGSSCECVNSTVPAGRPTAETPPKIAHGVNSLDQLRQLYKSAPDFGSLTGATQASNDRTSSSVTKQNNRRSAYIASSLVAAPPPSPPQYANLNDLRMASTESFSAQSPTDSGYRSAPRHLDAEPTSNNSTGVDGQASLTTIVRVNGSPSQPQKLYNGSLDNTSSTRSSHSGVRLVHRQPTSASKVARKMRSNTAANGSLDTINTNVSLSEEFSLERCPKLIEVDRIPWNDRDVVAVLQRGRTKELVHRISVDVVPKLTYVLQRPLIRLSRELQRLSANYGKCTKHDVRTAVKIVLTGSTAESCVTAGIQATSLYAMSGAEALRQSQSRRANLRFSVGKFHRWMVDMQIAGCVSELAAVFMTAVVECLLEELVLACVPSSSSSTTATADGARSTVSATDLRDDDPMLNADSFDATLADSAQLWGVMQPYEHLISCRTANGVVCLPQAINNYSRNPWHGEAVSKTVEQCLLAMCVGSVPELGDLISRVARVDESKHKCSWDKEALEALFYFMRCSQLEHQQQQQQQNGQAPSMSFAHERYCGLSTAHDTTANYIDLYSPVRHRNRADEPMSLKDFLAEGGQSPRRREQLNNMDSLSSSGSSPLPGLNLTKSQQRSLHEAMYYAAESGHLDIAVDLRNLGVGWNAHTWTQCLKAAHEQKRRTAVAALLADFGTRLADELTTDAIDDGVPLLFDILRVECKMADGDPTPCAAIVSRLYGRWDRRVDSALSSQSNPSGRAVIDPRYVNNSELSDVRFKIEGRIFYAHRIVLVNASSEFKQLLDEAHGDVELDDMNYQVFEMLMDYMYRGGAPMNLQHDSLSVQLQLLGAARRFGVHSLVRDCRVVVRDQLSDSNCLEVYRFAAQNFVDTLVADCETYLLENLPALVEDQNVRRAIYHSGRGGWPDLCGGLAARLAAALDVRLSSKRA